MSQLSSKLGNVAAIITDLNQQLEAMTQRALIAEARVAQLQHEIEQFCAAFSGEAVPPQDDVMSISSGLSSSVSVTGSSMSYDVIGFDCSTKEDRSETVTPTLTQPIALPKKKPLSFEKVMLHALMFLNRCMIDRLLIAGSHFRNVIDKHRDILPLRMIEYAIIAYEQPTYAPATGRPNKVDWVAVPPVLTVTAGRTPDDTLNGGCPQEKTLYEYKSHSWAESFQRLAYALRNAHVHRLSIHLKHEKALDVGLLHGAVVKELHSKDANGLWPALCENLSGTEKMFLSHADANLFDNGTLHSLATKGIFNIHGQSRR